MRKTEPTKKGKSTPKEKEPIKVKFKKLANGNQSIYLEQYNGYKKLSNGSIAPNRSYEFLKLYLLPDTKANEATNKATLVLANTIKSKKIVELQTQNSGLKIKKQTKVNLIEFVNEIANAAFAETNNRKSEYHTFRSLALHLARYGGDKLNISDVDTDYIKAWITYLKTAKNGNFENKKIQPTISKNTAHKLFAKFNTVLKKAVMDDIIDANPMQKIDNKLKPKTIPSKREYLTIEELKMLIDTDCKRPDIKNAFLFCCLVGIRFENVKNLKWGDLATGANGSVLSYKQIKTKTFETLNISDEAVKFLPTRGSQKATEKIYQIPKNDTTNEVLREWTSEAQITKDITFHCSRHTAATLQLSLGTPIETVSKLLGHTKISTTQIYAKIVDKNKFEAVNLQNGIFDKKTSISNIQNQL